MPMNPAAPVTRTLSPTLNSFAADQGQAFAQRIFELGRRSSCRIRVEMPRASEPPADARFRRECAAGPPRRHQAADDPERLPPQAPECDVVGAHAYSQNLSSLQRETGCGACL